MPLALPSSFDLDVEVLSRANDLEQIRIARLPFEGGSISPANPTSGSIVGNSWRRVHLHRDHHNVIVEVDGQPVSDEPFSEPSSDWLTIEPGSQSAAEFRELTVSW